MLTLSTVSAYTPQGLGMSGKIIRAEKRSELVNAVGSNLSYASTSYYNLRLNHLIENCYYFNSYLGSKYAG